MNDRPESMHTLARRACRLLALLLFFVFAGCGGGPGTGGTGTGPDASPAAGSVIVFVANVPAPASPSSAAGLEPDRGPCASPCGRAELVLRESAVELTVPCARFTSTGAWETAAAQSELTGTYTATNGGGSTRPATLRLQFDGAPATAASVTVTVLDAQRAILSGPAVLQRDAAGTGGAPGCP